MTARDPKPLIVHLHAFNNGERVWWSALVAAKGQPCIARIEAICWRKYKSKQSALRAGTKTCKRLFPGLEIKT